MTKESKGEEEVKNKKLKRIRVRVEESLISRLEKEAKGQQMSLNSYVNFLLNLMTQKKEVLFEERVDKHEKKEVESRINFTKSEAELLRRYAKVNEWSMSKEIRYRTLSTIATRPKLSGEELRAVYSVRASINVLGANINRLIKNNQVLEDSNIAICKELIELIQELRMKLGYLEKCNNTNYQLK